MRPVKMDRQEAEATIELIERWSRHDVSMIEFAAYLRREFGMGRRPPLDPAPTQYPATGEAVTKPCNVMCVVLGSDDNPHAHTKPCLLWEGHLGAHKARLFE